MKDHFRKILLFSILSLSYIGLSGQGRAEPVFSLEWGGSVSLLEAYHRNYIADEGYRVDEKGTVSSLRSNGQVILKAGVRFFDHYTVALNSGLMGIRQKRNVIPISARFTYNFDSYSKNGLLTFLEAGMIYPNVSYVSYLGQGGAGYRIRLSNKFSLDLQLSLRVCGDERRIYDPDTGEMINVWNIRKNSSTFLATVYSVSINF